MKLFCSNAFTGEDVDTVNSRMQMVVDSLNAAGHQAYCPVFDPHKQKLQEHQDTKAIFEYAFSNLSKCDGMVAIIASSRKSEGQLMEIGAVLSEGKPLYLLIKEDAAKEPTHLIKLATKTYVWKSEEDLKDQLAKLS